MTVKDRSKTAYGEHTTVLTKEKFRNWANSVGEDATDKNEVQHPVWIVPVTFCAIRDFDDGRYLPRGEVPETDRVQKTQETNVEFFQTETLGNAFGSSTKRFWE